MTFYFNQFVVLSLSIIAYLLFSFNVSTKLLTQTSFVAEKVPGFEYVSVQLSHKYQYSSPIYDTFANSFAVKNFIREFSFVSSVKIVFSVSSISTGATCADVFMERDNRMKQGLVTAITYTRPGCTGVLNTSIKNHTQDSLSIHLPIILGKNDIHILYGVSHWQIYDNIAFIFKK